MYGYLLAEPPVGAAIVQLVNGYQSGVAYIQPNGCPGTYSRIEDNILWDGEVFDTEQAAISALRAAQDDYPSLTDDEVARLERVAMYSSVEEYERYEGEDS